MSPLKPFYACACPTGIKLKPDNKTCNEGKHKHLSSHRLSNVSELLVIMLSSCLSFVYVVYMFIICLCGIHVCTKIFFLPTQGFKIMFSS
jgi:hypothetical protein